MKSYWILLPSLALVLAGCSGDDDDDTVKPPDAGTTTVPDAGSTTDPDAGVTGVVQPCTAGVTASAGGVSGGPLAGDLHVFAIDPAGLPLEGAIVVVEGAATYQATTDAAGCARFVDATLNSAVAVHVFAEGRPPESWYGVRSAIATSVVLYAPGAAPPPSTATIQGAITNIEVGVTASATVAAVAVVNPLLRSVVEASPQQADRPDAPFTQNITALGGSANWDFQTYTVTAFPEVTVGVFADAGQFTTPMFAQGVFTQTHLGFVTDLTLVPDQVLTGQDLTSTHLIDSEILTVTYTDDASLPDLDLWGVITLADHNGQFIRGFTEDPQMTAFPAPTLDGALAGGTYGAIVQKATPDFSRFTFRVERGGASPNVNVGPLPAVPGSLSIDRRTLTAAFGGAHDLGSVVFANQGALLWRVTAIDVSGTETFTLPDVPTGMTNPLLGLVDATTNIFDYTGFDATGFTFDDIYRTFEARAARQEVVEFEDPNAPPNPYACDAADPMPIPRGGLGGGAIAGKLTVHVLDGAQNAIRAAPVAVVVAGEQIVGETDRDGCMAIEDARLMGAVDLFVGANGNVAFVNVNASVVTVVADSAPNDATVSGTVSGLDLLAASTATIARIGIVQATQNDYFTNLPNQPPRMVLPVTQNVVLEGGAQTEDPTEYRLLANHENARGVFILAGTTDPSGATDLTHIGLGPQFTVTEGEVLPAQDVAVSTALDQSLVVNTPDLGLPGRIAFGYLRLPTGAIVTLGADTAEGTVSTFPAPALTGDFATAVYGGTAQIGTPPTFTLSIEEGDAALTRNPTFYAIPTMIAMTSARTISATLDAALTDRLDFTVLQNGNAIFSVSVFEPNANFSIELPDLPEPFPQAPASGTALTINMTSIAFAPGFDPNDADRPRFVAAIRASAGDEANVTVP